LENPRLARLIAEDARMEGGEVIVATEHHYGETLAVMGKEVAYMAPEDIGQAIWLDDEGWHGDG